MNTQAELLVSSSAFLYDGICLEALYMIHDTKKHIYS